MKKMLMLLSTCMITASAGTSIFGNAFISCRTAKSKEASTLWEEDDGNFEYGSPQENNKFSGDDFNRYVNSSLMPIISLLSHNFLDQSVDSKNFDFITVFSSLIEKDNSSTASIWNKQSVNTKDYHVDAFLDDWTFSELEQKDVELIKSIFVTRKNESKKQKKQNQLDTFEFIKNWKKIVKDKVKNIKPVIELVNSDEFKKKIDIDTCILNFMKKMKNGNISPFYLKTIPRFKQIFDNFVNATNFNDIKDLTDVNGQNLISYIKKPENIKMMNDNFKSKTDDEKAMMLFMIKFNYMYKYISATDGNPDNGEFLQEALLRESIIKIQENDEKVYENIFNYLKDIFNNNNSKSLEPLYCLIEGIMYIFKQKFYKVKIDQSIENVEIKAFFEFICEFVTFIKGDEKNNNELKYFKDKDAKKFVQDLVLETSLLEGIFIELDPFNKATVMGTTSLVATGLVTYCLVGLSALPSFGLGLVAAGATWWYNKTNIISDIPVNINDNFKNYYNTSWLLKMASAVTDYVNIAKMLDSYNLEDLKKDILNEYQNYQDYQEYIQTFDKIKNILNDKNNNFLIDLQNFLDNGGFKNIINDLFNLLVKIESSADNINDKEKKAEFSISVNNLFKSIGIDRQKKDKDIIITNSALKNLLNWINNPDNSFDKNFDSIVNLLEQDCKEWNKQNFENQIDNLTKVIKDKKDIEIEYVNFDEIKDSNSSNLIIRLNYKLKLLKTNEVYNIEFKNKDFKKFPKNFKISKFEKTN